MRSEVTWVLSLGAAALVPTSLAVAYVGATGVWSPDLGSGMLMAVAISAFVVALGHLIALGIPALAILSKMGQMKAWHDPIPGATSSHRNGEMFVQVPFDAGPTLPAWIGYVEGVLAMGMIGAAAAFVFWQVWKLSGHDRPDFNAI